MGLEIATYISGLTASWPTSGEPKSQGDDHLRLLKSVLQATFPNATKPYYLPASGGGSGSTLTVTSQNGILFYDTTAGNIAVTLPTLDVTQGGWSCEMMKYSADQNGVIVSPPSGTIFSSSGAVPTVRVGAQCATAKFYWSGSTWFCSKMGTMVGSVINWDGPGIPAGYLPLSGYSFTGSFVKAQYEELYLALGNTTALRDKRGRVEAGLDNGIGVLTANTIAGGGHIMGNVGGAELIALVVSQIPGHTHSGTTGSMNRSNPHSHTASTNATVMGGSGGLTYTGGIFTPVTGSVTVNGTDINHEHGFTTDAGSGGGSWHSNQPPTIIVQKLIRAC